MFLEIDEKVYGVYGYIINPDPLRDTHSWFDGLLLLSVSKHGVQTVELNLITVHQFTERQIIFLLIACVPTLLDIRKITLYLYRNVLMEGIVIFFTSGGRGWQTLTLQCPW